MIGVLFAALSALGFGAGQFFTQVGLRGGRVTALQGLLINLLAANATLLIALLAVWSRDQVPTNPAGLAYFVGAGLLAPLAGRGLNIAAIGRIGATRTASLGMSEALYATVIAWLLLGQVLAPLTLLGILVLVLGTVLFLNEAARSPGSLAVEGRRRRFGLHAGDAAVGVGLALLSGLFFAFAGIMRQLGLEAIPSAVLGAAVGTFSALLVTASDFVVRGWREARFDLSLRELVPLAAAGFSASLGMLFFFLALQHGGTVAASTALKNMTPLVTFLLARAFLARWERLSWRLAFLVALVVAGAALIAFGRAGA
jgi:drug/metabolite transporter (DMT)-like permease